MLNSGDLHWNMHLNINIGLGWMLLSGNVCVVVVLVRDDELLVAFIPRSMVQVIIP